MKVSFLNLILNYVHTLFLVINGLVLVPMYLNYFTLSTYGSYLAAANISGVLGLAEIGLSLVLTRKLSRFDKVANCEDFSSGFGAGLLVSATTLIVICLTSFFFMQSVPKIVKATSEIEVSIKWAFFLTSVGIGLNAQSNALNSVLQSMMKVGVPGVINLIAACVGIGTTIISLKCGAGVLSIAIGFFAKGVLSAGSIAIVVGFFCSSGECPHPTFSWVSYKRILGECWPVMVESISKAIVDNCQILIAASLIDPMSAAIYAITNKSYHVCSITLAPIGSSLYSTLARWSSSKCKDLLKDRLFKIFHLFSIFSGLIISVSFLLNENFILLWVGNNKYGGTWMSLLMCLAAFFSSRCAYLKFNLLAIGVFGRTLVLDQVLAVIRLLIILLLINKIGIYVLPLAELVTSIILSVGVLSKSLENYFGCNVKAISEIRRCGISSFALMVLIAFVLPQIVPMSESWSGFSVKLFISIIAFAFIIFLSGQNRYCLTFFKSIDSNI